MIDIISAEKFIRTLAGKDNLHMLCSRLIYKIEGHAGGIRQRFIHIILDFRQHTPILLFRNEFTEILGANLLGQILCIGYFIKFIIIKAHRKCLIRFGNRRNITGIDSAGEQGTNLHITNHMGFDRFRHPGVNLVHQFIKIRILINVIIRLPIPLNIDFSVLKQNAVGRRQFENPLEKCLRKDGVLEG